MALLLQSLFNAATALGPVTAESMNDENAMMQSAQRACEGSLSEPCTTAEALNLGDNPSCIAAFSFLAGHRPILV